MIAAFRPVAVFAALFALFATAVAEDKVDRKGLDEKLDRALKAYNDGDWKKFFADYAKQMEAIATKQTFDALYEGSYKKQFGKFKNRKFIEEGSVLQGEFLLLHYEAEFEKEKKAKISVNFVKEGKDYKFMQIQFNTASGATH